MSSNSIVGEAVVGVLAPLLGVHTSRRAFALACDSAKMEPSDATPGDIEAICDGLRPMLRTLLGAESADRVIRSVKRHVAALALEDA